MCPAADKAAIPLALSSWAAEFLGRPADLIPLAGDGGSRRYWRLSGLSGSTLAGKALLAMHGPDAAENRAWLNIGRHLKALGLNLPEIRGYQPEWGFFILEDLGDSHLADSLKNGPSAEAEELYGRTVRLMADFHLKGLDGFQSGWCHQEPVYDAAMVEEKEIIYFLESFLAGYLKQPKPGPEIRREAALFSCEVAREAPADVLIHRDFQSRNVLAAPNGPALIDWQGARRGPAAYDLASLLNDPYVSIPPGWRERFIDIYLEAAGRRDVEKFRRELLFTGAARLMQNLGAYGKFCGEGKDFSAWMLPAAERLAEHFKDPALAGWPLLAGCAAAALNQLKSSC
ncbi:hypothetical protein C4J81_07910 [Deltaproteobacteria bacterium Smac51]|nr:hypothetical protein C4J81_07910 [Deltaproteobacteria bacterium Smac51]